MDAKPYPKAQQLARGERRYRRKVASPKQWQAIIAGKGKLCRICAVVGEPSSLILDYHHLVSREDHGDDVADNIIPLCGWHHVHITDRCGECGGIMLASLSDAEYAYMIERGGENYPERAYGVSYGR